MLFALVYTDYNFLFVDVGCQGRISDGRVFKNSKLYNMLQKEELGFTSLEALPGKEKGDSP